MSLVIADNAGLYCGEVQAEAHIFSGKSIFTTTTYDALLKGSTRMTSVARR